MIVEIVCIGIGAAIMLAATRLNSIARGADEQSERDLRRLGAKRTDGFTAEGFGREAIRANQHQCEISNVATPPLVVADILQAKARAPRKRTIEVK